MSTSLALTNDEVLRSIAVVAGVGRDPVNDWDANFLQDARDIIRSGLRRFFQPVLVDGAVHQWRFLERKWEDHGLAAFDDGTVTVSAGTVTLAGGTWPTWADDGFLRISGRTLYVSSRDSGTQLTIEHDGVSHAAGTEYTLNRWRYGLPSDFGEFLGGVVYSKGSNQGYLLRSRDEAEIRRRYEAHFRTGETTLYSVWHGSDNDASEWYLSFWPTANENAVFAGRYRSAPEDNLETTLTDGGTTIQIESVHAETLVAAIQAATEEFYGLPGVHSARFAERLRASIKHDRHTAGAVDFDDSSPVNAEAVALFNHTPTYNDLLS